MNHNELNIGKIIGSLISATDAISVVNRAVRKKEITKQAGRKITAQIFGCLESSLRKFAATAPEQKGGRD